MSRFFIQRPIFATVISIVIVVAGLVSFPALPVAKFPEIAPPTVQVKAVYPGANAVTVAETVAAPIEQEVNGVEGMLYMSSASGADGSYTLTITFDIGTNLDMASVLVQNRVAIAEAKLPAEVRQQGITTKKQSTQILQFIALFSEDPEYSSLILSNDALAIRDALSRVAGVGDVQIFGAGDYSMRIWLDPQKLKQRQLTTEDVVAAIREQNVQAAAGQIGAEPAPAGTDFQLTVTAAERLEDVSQFEDIIIRSGADGRTLRVKDVARVELGGKAYTLDSRFNGQSSTSLAVYQLPGANALETAQRIREAMQQLSQEASWPAGLQYAIPFDSTKFVDAAIDEVYSTLLVAVVLVVLVIYIFLQDWRATIVPVAAIPVSLIGTFAAMNAIGFSINMLSLFGIVLAIGIVVDDAIVVVENSMRHIQDGLPPPQAAIKAMEEMTGPVIATTLVLLAVFVPSAFMGGITGQLFKQFALTISAAVLISTVNALTLSPALCGLVLRPAAARKPLFFRWFDALFDWLTNVYGALIARTVRTVSLIAFVYLGLLVFTGMAYSSLPTGFVPDEDQGFFFVNVQLPDAASQQRTDMVMRRVESELQQLPGVADIVSVVGYSLLSGTAGSNNGFMVVVLDPWSERRGTELGLRGVMLAAQGGFRQVKEAIVFAFAPPPIDGLGNAGGFQMELLDQGGVGYEQLQAAAANVVSLASQQSNLRGLNTTFRANVPQLAANVDREKVKNLQISLTSVFSTLQAYLGSAYVNDFSLNGRSYQVKVQAEPGFRSKREDIAALEVRDQTSQMIPLGAVLDIDEALGPAMVRRYNLYPSASINGSPAPAVSSGTAMDLMEQVAGAALPSSMGFQWTGMSYQERQAAGGQGFVLLLAVVFVFLVLAAQYESWSSPAAVIAVVPLATLGVVLALIARGADNNTYTQIGIVLLVALASKNAILIVEFARELVASGKSVREAAAEAAKLRFRAILMTAFSSILGFLPLLVAAGAGAASRQAIGNAVVGGMLAATFFSLAFVPAFFVIFQGGITKSQPPAPQPPAPHDSQPS